MTKKLDPGLMICTALAKYLNAKGVDDRLQVMMLPDFVNNLSENDCHELANILVHDHVGTENELPSDDASVTLEALANAAYTRQNNGEIKMTHFKPYKPIDQKNPALIEIKLTPEQCDSLINVVDCFGPMAGILKEAKFKSVDLIVSAVGTECVKYHGEASISAQDFLP